MTVQSPPLERARRTALWGQWICALVVTLFVAIIILFLVLLGLGHPEATAEFTDHLGQDPTAPPPLAWQRLLVGVLWMATDLAGVVMMTLAFRMFRGFRRGGFLTHASAHRLRLIGWCILAIAPLRMGPEAAALALYSHWTDPAGAQISFGIEPVDFYAVVIGMIILATGHIMAQAVEISEENKSFV